MEIDGIKIGSLESSVKPVYDYFKVDIGDEKIVEKIIDFINSLYRNTQHRSNSTFCME